MKPFPVDYRKPRSVSPIIAEIRTLRRNPYSLIENVTGHSLVPSNENVTQAREGIMTDDTMTISE
jgi:hypothetical protein